MATAARDLPAPEISSTCVSGERAFSSSVSAAPDSLAEEEVDERDVGLQRLGQLSASARVAGRRAALDPGLALEQQAEPPVDDVVIVDDEDAQARDRPPSRRSAPASTAARTDPTMRTCQRSPGSGPNSTRAPAGAPRGSAAAGRARRSRRCSQRLPSLVISSSNASPAAATRTSIRRGAARASRSCGAPRGRPTGRAARGAPEPRPPRATHGELGRPLGAALDELGEAGPRRAAVGRDRPAERRAQVGRAPPGARRGRCVARSAVSGSPEPSDEHEPEQPLHRPLVDLARELDPLDRAGGRARPGASPARRWPRARRADRG